MNDFISMMGYRETAIQGIINDINSGETDTDAICFRNGIPPSDLTYDERLRIIKETRG